MKPLDGRIAPGDLFYIPACDDDREPGFVIARYICEVEPNLGALIEVFDRFYTSLPATINEVDRSRRLFRPIMISGYFRKPFPRWKILFSDPGYDKSQSDYDNIGFAFRFSKELWLGNRIRPATDEELAAYEEAICWSADNIITRVIAHLTGVFGPEERYEYHRLPDCLKIHDNKYVFIDKLAIEVDEMFQKWHEELKGQRKPRRKKS